MNRKSILSLVTNIGVALIYWLIVAGYMHRPDIIQGVPSPLLKATPIILLAIYTLLRLRKSGIILAIGLALSACGDVAGDVPWGGFIHQIAFFLMAQIAYLVAFYQDARWIKGRLVLIVPLMAWMFYIAGRLTASRELHDPALAVAVGIYLAAITGMAMAAILRRADWWWVVGTGALLFVFSDSVIAWRRFIGEWSNSGSVVMWSYYLAQFLIAFGYTRGDKLAIITGETKQVCDHKGYT